MHLVNNERRITGKFVKQVWGGRKGDYANRIATVTFDATRAVLSRDIEFIRSLRDGDETSDEIGRECVGWEGPCEVYLTESVVEFFGLDGDEVPDLLIEQVTQEMLDQARASFGKLSPDSLVLEFRMTVAYSLNGERPEVLQDNLLFMVERAIGNGMLTGTTAAEVDEHSMQVTMLPTETVIEEVCHDA